jgi:O-antigen ligase
MTIATEKMRARPSRFSLETIRTTCISAIFISSFFVKFEPALADLFSFIALILFATSGLNFARSFAVPLLFMIIYLLAGVVSAIGIDRPVVAPYSDQPLQYSMVTAYISMVAILVAAYVAADPSRRYLQIERAWWIGATFGSILGLLVYLGIKPLVTVISAIGEAPNTGYAFRVVGGYKDPNVFSTWLVFPVVSMVQALALGRLRISVWSVSCLLLNTLALLLAFSRGAWFDVAVASFLTIGLSILLTPSLRQRRYVLLLGIGGAFLIVILLAGLLSIPSINAAFLDRFVLVKSYDAGETGRFGNQLNSIPMLLRMPMGLGAYQFEQIFGEAPHNTFLNSFASGGWIGGISYILWCLCTFYMGIKTVFTRSPYQAFAVPVVATFIVMTLQGLQIDNEHWRHWFWMMGLIWGLFAAMQNYISKGENPKAVLAGWSVN